jgi:hypothetical protein
MIEPYKPLIDSGLAAFLIFDSNKSAPKRHKKPPRSSLTVAAPLITPKHLSHEGKRLVTDSHRRAAATEQKHLLPTLIKQQYQKRYIFMVFGGF